MAPRWLRLAEDLKQKIDNGTYPVGNKLPSVPEMVAQGAGSINTVMAAYRELANSGYVVVKKGRREEGGTFVRRRTVIRIPLSRYGKVLRPGGTRGPWETATAEQNIDGAVRPISVEHTEAPDRVAKALRLPPSKLAVVYRHRHALADGDVVQIQRAWYPKDIAVAAGLDGPGKVVGGAFGAMTSAGLRPKTASEKVSTRKPTAEEAAELGIGSGVSVLVVDRVVKDADGRELELLETIAAGDRLELTYNNLPITEIE
ncbi:GntR family transcriptional regulator [Kitasatospora sp. NPDC048722]|uniref:GntR family transcriptional regulator n=1 Tax=Kitasatospora sp. NPDC048722 TaxID=3155639 RepID=UPI003401B68A